MHRFARRGFTLMEALMATGVLLVVVVAVTSAITAGQQNAFEAQQRIAGALAAEELMGRISTSTYARLPNWDGFIENAGSLTDMDGQPLPPSMQVVGREAHVTTGMKNITSGGLDVRVRGRSVTVRSFDKNNRTLASMATFVPEPQS
jgi:hypothetical protein